ncbi:MAG TPA: YihY/virulence factor BrkB family protein [Gemmatimonas sp.]|uniref:YihY/virulence factor BrkB family protein n=1 Tax=Gemmatimonas sp. TaxID=1962908 RepID=UPI002ED8C2BD
MRTNTLTRIRQKADSWWDIVRRVWQQSGEDNVPFLAGGLAFNILLAFVPFVLLLIGGLSFLLGNQPAEAVNTVSSLVGQLLPNESTAADALLRGVITDVLETRGAVTLYSAIGFAWFSTRLFGSLRSVLALTFDGSDRSIVAGKLFDLLATVVATLVVVLYVVFSAYLDLATTRGLTLLRDVGLRESAMGGLTYLLGRALAVLLVFALFSAMYRGLPRRRPPVRVAFVGGATAAVLFELARHLFAILVRNADPSSLYTGTIAAIVAIVFWTYYAAFLFLIGAEVAQAYDLRQRELSLLDEPPLHATVNRMASGKAAGKPEAASKGTPAKAQAPVPPATKPKPRPS